MLKERIELYIENEFAQRISSEQNFFFQKGQHALNKWINMELTSEQTDSIISFSLDYNEFKKIDTSNRELFPITQLLFEIISYCDNKANEKKHYNQYEDSRTFANAGVRMGAWIRNLVEYKFNSQNVTGSIKNAFNYLLDPTKNTTVLSENHRKFIVEYYLKKDYKPVDFTDDCKSIFKNYNLSVLNDENYTFYISSLIYNLGNEWKPNVSLKFKDLVKKLEKHFISEKIEFSFAQLSSRPRYVWISDKSKNIGNHIAHYEIGFRSISANKNEIYVDIHFESTIKAEKDIFYNRIKILPKNLEWFDWQGSKSIGYKEVYKLDDDDIVDNITTALEYIEENIGDSIREIISELSTTNTNTIVNKLESMKLPLNQILYGPPGTGKTYNTILEAAKIITGNESISYQDALEVFNDNLNNRIEFITFHQNYSYEDFIQGIRPDIENGKELSFEKKDGILKKIADRALFEYYIENQKLKTASNELFVDATEAYLDFFNQLSVGQEFSTKKNKKINIIQLNKNKNIVFKYQNGSKPVLVSSNRLLKLYSKIADINQIQNINEDVRAAIGGCDASVYYTMLREFIIFYDENKKRIQDEDDYQDTDYLDITEERKKEILSQITLNELRNISKDSVKKYVIIIDEINRANISRVFGELITLIEEDKRSHGKIPMRVTLPSGDTFIVPSNLHIVGTMNTADKSISLLDIALRRRFDFVPMYPLYDGLEKPVYFPDILKKMNEKIKKIKGPDFQIGHAYFMESDNLLEIMNRKVIPLLLEYFMNDETQVKEIITIEGYLVDEHSWPMKLNKA